MDSSTRTMSSFFGKKGPSNMPLISHSREMVRLATQGKCSVSNSDLCMDSPNLKQEALNFQKLPKEEMRGRAFKK